MTDQTLLDLPPDQQWEYAILTSTSTAGFFGTIGAKESVGWQSTLGENVEFQQSPADLLERIGKAGWELVSASSMANLRGGTTHEVGWVWTFKQRRAASEQLALAQLITPAALLGRGLKALESGNPALALQILNKAITLAPKQIDLYYQARGQVHLAMGDEDAALLDFDRALQTNPQDGLSHLQRADIAFRRNDWQIAADHYDQALRNIREDSQGTNAASLFRARKGRARAFEKLGRVKDAIKDAKECLARFQIDPTERAEIEGWIKEMERRR